MPDVISGVELAFPTYESIPTAQPLTIPAAARGVIVFAMYTATATAQGFVEAGFTLSDDHTGGPDAFASIASDGGSNDYPGCAVAAFFKDIAFTESQNLAIQMAGSVSEGAHCLVAYIEGNNTTAWRDAITVANQAGESTGSLTTVSGDLVLNFGFQYSYTTGTPPDLPTDFASLVTGSNSGEGFGSRISYITASDTTQACESGATVEADCLAAISIPDAGGGGGGGNLTLIQNSNLGNDLYNGTIS